MKTAIKKTFALCMMVCMLALALPAYAQSWSARFSLDAVTPLSQEAVDRYTDAMVQIMGTEDADTGYSYSIQIVGEIELNGDPWILGRLSWLVAEDGHLSLLSDFLMTPDAASMYFCDYPDADTIAWSDEEAEAEPEPEPETIGDTINPQSYEVKHVYRLTYDAAFLKPDGEGGFAAVSGDSRAFCSIAVVTDLNENDYEDFMREAVGDAEILDEAIITQDGNSVMTAEVPMDDTIVCYYLASRGEDGALAITASYPASEAGEWDARFDLMVQSLTF